MECFIVNQIAAQEISEQGNSLESPACMHVAEEALKSVLDSMLCCQVWNLVAFLASPPRFVIHMPTCECNACIYTQEVRYKRLRLSIQN